MRLLVLVLILSIFANANTALAKSKTALETLQAFYKVYLPISAYPAKRPKLGFSKSFLSLVKSNRAACKKYAGTDLCGWGADGDVYLDAQEYEPGLKFESAGFKFQEALPGHIKVTMNIYPSLENARGSYDREIIFVMIQEQGKWVADNIVYSRGSAREMIKKEVDSMRKSQH